MTRSGSDAERLPIAAHPTTAKMQVPDKRITWFELEKRVANGPSYHDNFSAWTASLWFKHLLDWAVIVGS